MKRINIGVIGVGLIGNAHLLGLLTCIEEGVLDDVAEVRISALADIDEARLQERGELYGVADLTTDGHVLCARDDIDVIYICTPTSTHHEFFLSAAKHGKHVFVEKPVGTMSQIAEMDAAAKANDIISQVGLVLRYHPLFWYLRHIVEQNKDRFGPLQNVVFRDDQTYPHTGTGSHPSTWRADKEIAYHGTLFEHSIHDLDQIMLLCGPVQGVAACIKYFGGIDGIEDSASVLLDFASGTTASLTSIWYATAKDTRRAELFFTNACVELDMGFLGSGSLQYKRLNEQVVKVISGEVIDTFHEHVFPGLKMPKGTPYFYENVAFLRSIVDGVPGSPGLDEARRVHAVLEACYQSSTQRAFLPLLDASDPGASREKRNTKVHGTPTILERP